MTESERDLLMPFLRKLRNTRTTPGDDAAINLIRSAVGRQPNAVYLLVQRALILETELASAQARIQQLEGEAPAEVAVSEKADFLDSQTAGWGEEVDRNGRRSRDKKLYDMFKQLQPAEGTDLETRAVNFLTRNAGKVWAFIVVLGCAVVLLR